MTSSQRRSARDRSDASRTIESSRSRPTNCAPCRRSGVSSTLQEPVRGNRFGLAFELERLDRLDLGGVADERTSWLSEQHLARPGRLLEPRRNVHRIARQPVLGARYDLARHYADPPFQPELRQRVPHLDCRTQRTERVVLVHHRHAENGHHRVADELLHAAAVALGNPLHPLEVA